MAVTSVLLGTSLGEAQFTLSSVSPAPHGVPFLLELVCEGTA